MDLRLRVITPNAFDVPNCDPHLVEFSPDMKYVTIRGSVTIGTSGQLRLRSDLHRVAPYHCALEVSGFWRKRWTLIPLDGGDLAVWMHGPILRLSRDGYAGPLEQWQDVMKKEGKSINQFRFAKLEIGKGCGLMITTDMKANLVVE